MDLVTAAGFHSAVLGEYEDNFAYNPHERLLCKILPTELCSPQLLVTKNFGFQCGESGSGLGWSQLGFGGSRVGLHSRGDDCGSVDAFSHRDLEDRFRYRRVHPEGLDIA